MGKKFKRLMASGNDVGLDPRWQFEVAAGEIITYKGEPAGGLLNLLQDKFKYAASATVPITSKTTVELSLSLDSNGSGYCDVKTGENFISYHILKEAKEFCTAVQREIDNAPS